MTRATVLLATTALSLLLSSCTEDIVGDDLFGTGTMTATIDGQPWEATSIIAVRTNLAATVSGVDSDGVTVRLFFEPGPSDSYPVDENTPNELSVTDGGVTWSASETGGSGTITLSTLTAARGVGTFSFTALVVGGSGAPQRAVTAGAFDIRW